MTGKKTSGFSSSNNDVFSANNSANSDAASTESGSIKTNISWLRRKKYSAE